MKTVRYAASFLALAILVGMCAFLYAPTRELPLLNSQGSIGPGAVPLAVIAAVAVLSFLVAIVEARKLLTRAPVDGLQEASLTVTATSFVLRSAAVIAMLAAYSLMWKYTHFIPSTIAFFAVLGLFLLEPEKRDRRSVAVTIITAVVFAPAIWFAFERLLGVPLR